MKYKVSEEKQIDIKFLYYSQDDFYKILAINENNQEMGYLTFKIKNGFSRKLWLNKIETKQEFQNQKVGTALIGCLEYFAGVCNIDFIEGKFYPTNDYAKPFYLKHGYEIYKDEYEWFVDKTLNLENTKVELKDKVIDFEVENVETNDYSC